MSSDPESAFRQPAGPNSAGQYTPLLHPVPDCPCFPVFGRKPGPPRKRFFCFRSFQMGSEFFTAEVIQPVPVFIVFRSPAEFIFVQNSGHAFIGIHLFFPQLSLIGRQLADILYMRCDRLRHRKEIYGRRHQQRKQQEPGNECRNPENRRMKASRSQKTHQSNSCEKHNVGPKLPSS